MAKERLPRLGKHTSDHAILVNYEPEGVGEQIESAQCVLRRLMGVAPTSIAYPNGDYDSRVVRIAQEAGLSFGLTVKNGLNLVRAQSLMEPRRITIWAQPAASWHARSRASMAPGLPRSVSRGGMSV
jgi:peptidoglycan/xylan/chitin deacetylase (PgdA/CDA1 family)